MTLVTSIQQANEEEKAVEDAWNWNLVIIIQIREVIYDDDHSDDGFVTGLKIVHIFLFEHFFFFASNLAGGWNTLPNLLTKIDFHLIYCNAFEWIEN